RRGAVLIEVPIDVMHMPVAEALVSSAVGIRTQPGPAPAASELDAALKLLRSAERPAIICGGRRALPIAPGSCENSLRPAVFPSLPTAAPSACCHQTIRCTAMK